MTTEQLSQLLQEHFSSEDAVYKEGKVEDWIEVGAEKIKDLCLFLRDDERTLFDELNSISGVDYPTEDKIVVVYHLFSYTHLHSLVVKVPLEREEPHIATVETVWKAANWLEREVFDTFGVIFDHHSDLRRILLPDDWEGYPLRKDYVVQKTYHGIEVSVDRPLEPTTIKAG